jgi:serine/threonine-protein kinase
MSDELAGWLTGRLPRFAGREPEKDAASATPPDRRKSGINRRYLLPLLLLLLAAVFVILVVQLRAFFIVPEVQVPHVEGLSATQAVEVLTEAGLGSQIVDQIPDDNVPVGHVLRQTPAPGRMVKKNRQVDLILSTGPVLVEVAEVIGKTELEATLILQGQGFTVTPIEEFSDQPPGTVIRQDPGRGFKLPRGREVKLTISKGGRPFKLRDLTGLTLEDARSWLELFGLVERFVEERESEQPAGIVIGQHPAAGELVKSGDPVDLEVSKGMGNTSPVQRSIRIDTSSIPLGEKIVLTISDSLGRRVENYVNTGETIVTQGFGYGEVEVRWQDKVEKKNFPE